MEVLTFAGLPTVLFLDPPTPADLARFPQARAVGLAGDARTWPPARMRAELPALFASLRALGAPILHYKLCSTLDSAPDIGSIGTAAEIALAAGDDTGGALAPLVVAAPQIGRWQAFGTLFARAGDGIHRLDRHPTMAHHPVTPMDEADVLRHLARQTTLPLALIDLLDLKSGARAPPASPKRRRKAASSPSTSSTTKPSPPPAPCSGRPRASSSAPRASNTPSPPTGAPPASSPRPRRPRPSTPPSASPSSPAPARPTTAAQIDAAEAAGFAVIALDPRTPDWDAAAAAALAALARGRSPLVASARGRNDTQADPALGTGLGRLLDRLIREGGVTRSVIAGGDTSSHAARALGLTALTAETPIAPGASLLHGHRREGPPIELVLKGGQMGPPDFFIQVRDGMQHKQKQGEPA